MKTHEVLQTALDYSTGDRQRTHGDKITNHQNIAEMWNAYLKVIGIDGKLMPSDVAMLMSLMKTARSAHGDINDDDYIDGAAYMAISGECKRHEIDQGWVDEASGQVSPDSLQTLKLA